MNVIPLNSNAPKMTQEGVRALLPTRTAQIARTQPADSLGALAGNTLAGLPIVVAEWPKNQRETIRVNLAEYQGRTTVDVRACYEGTDGNLKPSPKGLTMGIGHLPQLADAVAKALSIALERGFIRNDGGQA